MKTAADKNEYCVWPPRLAADVEMTEQRDNRRAVFIAGSVSDEDAKKKFPKGFETVKPYLRVTEQPDL